MNDPYLDVAVRTYRPVMKIIRRSVLFYVLGVSYSVCCDEGY